MEGRGSRRVREPLLPIENRLMAALATGLLCLYIATALYPATVNSVDHRIHFLTVNHYRHYLFYGMFTITLSLLVLMALAFLRKREFGWAPLAILLLAPIFVCGGWLMDWSGADDVAMVKDGDGSEYHLFKCSDWDSATHVIVKLESKSIFQTRYRVLADGGEDGLPVVRPKGAKENPQLCLNSRHQLVGVDFEHYAVACFDLTHESPIKVGDISPFALLGPRDEPNLEDYRTLTDFQEEGVPDFGVVLGEFDHPNPRVRALARGLACRMVVSL